MRALLYFLPFILIFVGCRPSVNHDVSTFDTMIYEPHKASRFKILGSEDRKSTVIEVRDPWQGADSVITRLLILRGGESIPDGFDGQVLDGEASRIVVLSSSYIAMLDAIGEVDRIVGVSGLGFISNNHVRSKGDLIADVGYDGNFDYEALIAAEPDLVLLYGVNGSAQIEKQLQRLGVPFLYVGEYLEQSPVAKAEWLVAVAETVGKREKAESLLRNIENRYDSITSLVKNNSDQKKPVVMLNTPYGDTWYMPSADNYIVRLIDDAGGSYVYDKNRSGSSVPIDYEEAYVLLEKSDYWLNLGSVPTIADLKQLCPKHVGVGVVRDRHVYNNDLRSTKGGGNDFWESGVIYPDLILEDLAKIFHPGLFAADDTVLHYYRHL